MKRIGQLFVWALLAFIAYAWVVKYPSPEFWQWITH